MHWKLSVQFPSILAYFFVIAGFLVEFVLNLPDQFLQNIFESNPLPTVPPYSSTTMANEFFVPATMQKPFQAGGFR